MKQRTRLGRFGVAHGEAKVRTPEYQVWISMWSRCTNPKGPFYPIYGGRGIRVCEAWRSYSTFLADMGRRPASDYVLDRIDNDGHYEPGNCRWADGLQSRRNRRDGLFVTIDGQTRHIGEWADLYGVVTRRIAAGRIRRGGWTPLFAVTVPCHQTAPRGTFTPERGRQAKAAYAERQRRVRDLARAFADYYTGKEQAHRTTNAARDRRRAAARA